MATIIQFPKRKIIVRLPGLRKICYSFEEVIAEYRKWYLARHIKGAA